MNTDYTEEAVCRVDDLADGQMKDVRVGDTDVLLARVDGQYYALYPKCAHYQAPLQKGLLHGHRLICPWHNACFDVRNGLRLEAPALNGLTTHEVRIENDQVLVRLTTDKQSMTNPLVAADESNTETCVIVGSGGAGAFAAEALREGGFTGRIIMLTQSQEGPYDRPNCSKNYLQGKAPDAWMPLRDDAFYKNYGIEIRTSQRVTYLDPATKQIELESGETLAYDRALICPGGQPNQLTVAGSDLDNVFTLRSLHDSQKLRKVSQKGKRVVIVGSSFIGLEAAMSLRKLGCEVAVVGQEKVAFEKILGERVGRVIQGWHEKEGITFHLGRQVKEFAGTGAVSAVVLDNGEEISADFVLLGIGVKPQTDFLQGIALEPDGGVKTDKYLRIADSLFAAGDIAHYPTPDGFHRTEHWKIAGQQGHIAGLNMAGHKPMEFYQGVPFFWSNQQSKRINYIGYGGPFDTIAYEGNPETDEFFLAYFIKNEQVIAVAAMKCDKDIIAIRELMRLGFPPSANDVRRGANWVDELKKYDLTRK
jgi:apoptosis-inducing factor 3